MQPETKSKMISNHYQLESGVQFEADCCEEDEVIKRSIPLSVVPTIKPDGFGFIPPEGFIPFNLGCNQFNVKKQTKEGEIKATSKKLISRTEGESVGEMKARKAAEKAAREANGQDEHGWYIDAKGGRHATETARRWANERHGESANATISNSGGGGIQRDGTWYLDSTGTRHATETGARWANEREAKKRGNSGNSNSGGGSGIQKQGKWFVDSKGNKHVDAIEARWANERNEKKSSNSGFGGSSNFCGHKSNFGGHKSNFGGH